jgi:hypothetical protein
MRRLWVTTLLSLLFVAGGAAHATPRILIGADVFEYTGGSPPSCFGQLILADYGQPTVRNLVVRQLSAMRAAGLASLRFNFSYQHDNAAEPWFPSSRTGRLEEPFRTNLIAYLADVRRAGFQRLTILFNPRNESNPVQVFPRNDYDPAIFDESWALIRDVRGLVQASGIPERRYDLIGEGAPSDYLSQQVASYDERIYARYVDAFGADDVTISAPFWTGMQGLIDALRASGRPLPRWFDIHPRFLPANALADLHATDATLSANGLSQPLVVGEEKYNDAAVAAAIAEFVHTASRPIEEVDEWPLIMGGEQALNQQPSCPSPPYRIDAYAKALTGSPPATRLTASLSNDSLTFRTPYGQLVSALEAGNYTIAVSDRSKLRGFTFAGKSTTRKFRGTTAWRLSLKPGEYLYRVVGKRPQHGVVDVLAGG